MAEQDKARSLLEIRAVELARTLIYDRVASSVKGGYALNLKYWTGVKDCFENIVSQIENVN